MITFQWVVIIIVLVTFLSRKFGFSSYILQHKLHRVVVTNCPKSQWLKKQGLISLSCVISTIGWWWSSIHNNYSMIQADGAAHISNDVPTVLEQEEALVGLLPANEGSSWKGHTAYVLTTHCPELVTQTYPIPKVTGSCPLGREPEMLY